MRIFLEGALAFGVILVHQLVILLLCSASHVGLVGIDLFLLEVLGAWVLLDALFFIVGDSQQYCLLLKRVQVDIINV